MRFLLMTFRYALLRYGLSVTISSVTFFSDTDLSVPELPLWNFMIRMFRCVSPAKPFRQLMSVRCDVVNLSVAVHNVMHALRQELRITRGDTDQDGCVVEQLRRLDGSGFCAVKISAERNLQLDWS